MTPDLPSVEIAIVEMTNAFRREQRLGELKRNRLLDAAAAAFARYLARTDTFSHTADGQRPGERAAKAGYEYCHIAENLALYKSSLGVETRALARSAMDGWKKSPGHRKNLLAAYANEIGVGVAKADGRHAYYSVQLFGRPAALRYTFTVRNPTPAKVRYAYHGEAFEISGFTGVTHTVCQPGAISFPEQTVTLKSGPALVRPVDHPTGAGDTFEMRLAPSGRIVVDHRPRLN